MQKLYLLKSRSHFFAYKIGISNNVKRRVAEISKSSKIRVSVVLSMPLLFAYKIEQVLHYIYRYNRVRSIRGNGGTEWFWFVLPVSPVLLILLFFGLQLCPIIALIYFLICNLPQI